MSEKENEQLEEQKSYLSFKLDDELFAANVENIFEILEVPAITKVPRSPEYLKGVINLRGNVLPIIDSRIKFQMSPTELAQDTCIIVIEIQVEGEQVMIGAMVDSVLEVLEIFPSQIKPSPSIGSTYDPEFIEGIVQMDDNFIMLLDIGKVFSIEEISELSELSDNQTVIEE